LLLDVGSQWEDEIRIPRRRAQVLAEVDEEVGVLAEVLRLIGELIAEDDQDATCPDHTFESALRSVVTGPLEAEDLEPPHIRREIAPAGERRETGTGDLLSGARRAVEAVRAA